MANIKSAKKRILVAQTKTERNKSIRSKVKTSIKKVEAAVAANDKEAAKAVGEKIAKLALEKGITNVVFDRGGYIYHGRVQALADGAREGGLKL